MSQSILNPCTDIKLSCAMVATNCNYAFLDEEAMSRYAEDISTSIKDPKNPTDGVEWDECDWHYNDNGGPLTCQYIFVMDALNFCFWPTDNNFEYDTLAVSLKNVLETDNEAFRADRLVEMSKEVLQSWFPTHKVPLIEERVVCLQELGAVLEGSFDGLAMNMVTSACGSAVKLVKLITAHLPHFRDTAVYKGRLVSFYKRAQILVGDLWAAYKKPADPSHPCCFRDIDQLTMFADYRVPQILRAMNILKYAPSLAARIDSKELIPFGSEEEIEIRALTVVAVEKLHQMLVQKGLSLLVIECDWLLWQRGEKMKDDISPHHRTLTVYY